MNTRSLLLPFALGALAACSSPPAPIQAPTTSPIEAPAAKQVAPMEAPTTSPSSQATSMPGGDSLTPSASAIAARVQRGLAQLKGQGEGGALVLASIEHHGGLARWYEKGALSFRFRYASLDPAKPAQDTWQAIDLWSSRARHQVWDKREVEFGWDGARAWGTVEKEALGSNPRFWALTPYYFVALPFVFADPGVQVAALGEESLEGRSCDLVKVTFAQGTGDAPDDYYIAYLDRDTKRVAAVRYVVSYKGFFPEGGHSPEKIMIYDGERDVDGIKLAQSLRSYKWGPEGMGEQVTANLFEEVKFDASLKPSFFTLPEGAMVYEGY